MSNNKQNSHKKNGTTGSNNNPKKSNDNKINEQFHWKKAGKTSLVWVLIIISAIFMSNLFTDQAGNEVEIQYSEYRTFLNNGLITKARIIDEVFYGELSEPQTIVNSRGIG